MKQKIEAAVEEEERRRERDFLGEGDAEVVLAGAPARPRLEEDRVDEKAVSWPAGAQAREFCGKQLMGEAVGDADAFALLYAEEPGKKARPFRLPDKERPEPRKRAALDDVFGAADGGLFLLGLADEVGGVVHGARIVQRMEQFRPEMAEQRFGGGLAELVGEFADAVAEINHAGAFVAR